MIREMKQEDLKRVASIEAENFSRPWSYQGFADVIDGEHTLFLVCEDKDQIVGYIGAYLIGREMEITNVSVDRKEWGKGYGKKLLLKLLEMAEERGVSDATLEVRVGNESAISLYHHAGFEDAGIRPNFYDDPKEDALIMWKRKPE